ncbi:MAG: hypothetical protein WCE30_05350 [Mycobacterium sp.]
MRQLAVAVQRPLQLLGRPLAGINAGRGDRIADRSDVAAVQPDPQGHELSRQLLDGQRSWRGAVSAASFRRS